MNSINSNHETADGPSGGQITLRSAAELADALPYLLGYHPTDSVVLVALHGSRGRCGGRVRMGIPRSPLDWPAVAGQLAGSLIRGAGPESQRPDGIVLFLCQDPGADETGAAVMTRLRPFAQQLRTSCGELDVPVYEALCISGGRYWSYCCPDNRCCPLEGSALMTPGTSVMAAAATYAGLRVRGTLREMEARLEPLPSPVAERQEKALDRAAAALVPKVLVPPGREVVRADTIALARALITRIAMVPCASGTRGTALTDTTDDRLITDDEAAAMILGLQDRETRDRAAEWMEGPDAAPALRLWRALSRRCVRAYAEHAAPPLALAGWVAWSSGDEAESRAAFGLALRRDPDYLFARLLHQAQNENFDPEDLRVCLRGARDTRPAAPGTTPAAATSAPPAASTPDERPTADPALPPDTESSLMAAGPSRGRPGPAIEHPADAEHPAGQRPVSGAATAATAPSRRGITGRAGTRPPSRRGATGPGRPGARAAGRPRTGEERTGADRTDAPREG
jgi:hypothetical protein